MSWCGWLGYSPSLARQAAFAVAQQGLKNLSYEELQKRAQKLLQENYDFQNAMTGAINKIAELEIKNALMDVNVEAAMLHDSLIGGGIAAKD